jgi:2-amino-4-hydroxy-6-hydroxymethyldihydropteridine diphosphokinase
MCKQKVPKSSLRHTTYIALGSNMPSRVGDPHTTLHAALRILANWGTLAASPLLTTEPWGNTDQPPFQNAVARLETEDFPEDLLQRLHCLEEAFGRDRRREAVRWQPRCLDLDLIFYGTWDKNNVFQHTHRDTGTLKLPHALWAERPFVKEPLRLVEPRYEALIKDVILHSH